MSPAPKTENEEEEDTLRCVIAGALLEMIRDKNMLPSSYIERTVMPKIKLALLDVQIREAQRCDVYGNIGSPRVLQLKALRNRLVLFDLDHT